MLHWADGGWVHTFTKTPGEDADDLRRLKLFTAAGDPDGEPLYKEFGFHVVPLSITDLITSLQTGMIEAFATVPLFAQLQESYKLAPHMIDVRWTPLVGGTVISKSVGTISPSERPALLDAARHAGAAASEHSTLGWSSIVEMQKRGLHVIDVDEARQESADRRGSRVSATARPLLPGGPLRHGARCETKRDSRPKS